MEKKYPKLAVYNTGFGLAISAEAGPEVPAFLRQDFLKIKTPDSDLPSAVWDAQWEVIKQTANDLVAALNEKNGYIRCEYCEQVECAPNCIARE